MELKKQKMKQKSRNRRLWDG